MSEHFDMSPRIDFPITGMNYELSGSLDALVGEQNSQPSAPPPSKGQDLDRLTPEAGRLNKAGASGAHEHRRLPIL
jgi:hypothetical protein